MKPLSRTKDLVVQDLGDETLVYDLISNVSYCLNETSTHIWKHCNGKANISEITRLASETLKTKISENFVTLALQQFTENKLLENGDELSLDFSGISRRSLIKKVGFASVVALPMIASVVAPSAAAAQSLLPFLAACTAPGQCLSGNCSGDAFSTPKCCVPGSIASCPPGDLVITFECRASVAACNAVDGFCCSNSTTLGPQGICGPGLFECRCD